MAFRSYSLGPFGSTSATTCVVPVPPGAQAGDLIEVAIYCINNVTMTGMPSGFASKPSTTYVPGGLHGITHYAWKRLTTAETGSWTFTLSGSSGGCAATATALSGRLASGDPFDYVTALSKTAATGGPPALSGTASAGSDAVYQLFSWNYESGLSVASFTTRLLSSDAIYLFTRDNVPAGTLDPVESGYSGSDAWWGCVWSVKPAAGGSSYPIAATLSGAGALATDLRATRPIGSTQSGAGALTAALGASRPVASTLAGAGGLSAQPRASRALSSTVTGSGGLTAELRASRALAATITGSGTLNAEPQRSGPIAAALSGAGRLDAALAGQHDIAATLNGSGALHAEVVAGRPIATHLSGEGSLTADLAGEHAIAAILAASGTFAAALAVPSDEHTGLITGPAAGPAIVTVSAGPASIPQPAPAGPAVIPSPIATGPAIVTIPAGPGRPLEPTPTGPAAIPTPAAIGPAITTIPAGPAITTITATGPGV